MSSLNDFLKRAADRNGFRRDRYDESKVPTDFSNVCILPYFGDVRSTMILSSFILNRFREENKGSKYFILASWPGSQGLFPYVDEYWSMTDDAVLKRFYDGSDGFRNHSDLATVYTRNLNEFFRDVVNVVDLQKIYQNGFTNYFFEKYKDTKRFLPFVPSSSVLGKDFNRDLAVKAGYKVFLHPSIFAKFWHSGRSENIKVKREFYIELIRTLSSRNITPVVWQNFLSFDLTDSCFDKAIIFKEPDIIRAMAAMRATGCVLDIFNGLSRYALMARTAFTCVDERTRYNSTKEHEIDDLCGGSIPKQYIFTFSTILTEGTLANWNADVFPSIVNRLENFMPNLNRDEWPSTAESHELVAYDKLVRIQKPKKFGTRFIKVIQD